MDSTTTFSGELMSFFMFWGGQELTGNKLSGFCWIKGKKKRVEPNNSGLAAGMPEADQGLHDINQLAGTVPNIEVCPSRPVLADHQMYVPNSFGNISNDCRFSRRLGIEILNQLQHSLCDFSNLAGGQKRQVEQFHEQQSLRSQKENRDVFGPQS
jgi:hypothetical protein